MSTLSILFIVVFSALFLYAIYRISFAGDDTEPVEGGGDGNRNDDVREQPTDDPVEDPEEPTPAKPTEKPLDVKDFDIPTRAVNALKEEGIKNVADLAEYDDYSNIPGIGSEYAEDIRQAIGDKIKNS